MFFLVGGIVLRNVEVFEFHGAVPPRSVFYLIGLVDELPQLLAVVSHEVLFLVPFLFPSFLQLHLLHEIHLLLHEIVDEELDESGDVGGYYPIGGFGEERDEGGGIGQAGSLQTPFPLLGQQLQLLLADHVLLLAYQFALSDLFLGLLLRLTDLLVALGSVVGRVLALVQGSDLPFDLLPVPHALPLNPPLQLHQPPPLLLDFSQLLLIQPVVSVFFFLLVIDQASKLFYLFVLFLLNHYCL